MKSAFKSVGRIFPLLMLVGCAGASKPREPAPSVQVREELAGEVSLKSDREELAELRREIPEEKRQANDELALVLGLMGEVKLEPSAVHARIQQAVQKRRDVFRKKVAKLRDDFRKSEADRKEKFLARQKSEREAFSGRKREREETREFFSAQDLKRREFFAGEADRRKDFESEIKTQSADFDSYMRERQRELSEQARLYSRRYHEAKKRPPVPAAAVQPAEPATSR